MLVGFRRGTSDGLARPHYGGPVDPGRHPVIKGTRVPVKIIVDALAGGSSVEEVRPGWRITREDVLAALGYAADAV